MSGAVPGDWRHFALDPPRAFGTPPARGRIRVEPEDFVVEELLDFAPAGDGPHLLLRVLKRGANTEWVARELARRAGCRPFEVGFAGLKDRHAVTTQWYTVPRGKGGAGDWQGLSGEGYRVLEAYAHRRKLPRGALAGNRFELRIRALEGDRAALVGRLAQLGELGAPDYFGPQRFGQGLSNLVRVAAGDYRTDRAFGLSAARSLIFNAVLAAPDKASAKAAARIRPGSSLPRAGKSSRSATIRPPSTRPSRCARKRSSGPSATSCKVKFGACMASCHVVNRKAASSRSGASSTPVQKPTTGS